MATKIRHGAKARHTLLARHVLWALGGSLTVVIIKLTFLVPEFLAKRISRNELASEVLTDILLGFVAGWLLDVGRDLTVAAERMQRLNDSFLQYLEHFFARDPYALFMVQSPHTGVIGTLVSSSIRTGYKRIFDVDENLYLRYLEEAVAVSRRFEGIQIHPVRWFFSNGEDRSDGGSKHRYLETLKNRRMDSKTRVFVIGDNEIANMRTDLENSQLMQEYWAKTGTDVRTFWIAEKKLKSFYNFQERFEDYALYDDHLLIKYDSLTKVLQFDIISPDDQHRRIFRSLTNQLESGSNVPFSEIRPHEVSDAPTADPRD
jgi:hypothetical protein